MVKAAHLRVSDNILSSIQSKLDWKVNRAIYLFGSIAPDLNCIYPMHTFNATIKRFKKKLKRIDKYNSILIRSFTFGVITHYICDYFCYAHNIKAIDKWHPIYEMKLGEHIKLHENQIGNFTDDMIEQWDNIKKHILDEFANGNKVDDIIKSICSNSNDHIQYILDAVSNMHEAYINKTKFIDADSWYLSTNKMNIDIEYASFMCEKVISLIFGVNGEEGYGVRE